MPTGIGNSPEKDAGARKHTRYAYRALFSHFCIGAYGMRLGKRASERELPHVTSQDDLWSPMLLFGGHQYDLQRYGTYPSAR